jgi:hypothetical protein
MPFPTNWFSVNWRQRTDQYYGSAEATIRDILFLDLSTLWVSTYTFYQRQNSPGWESQEATSRLSINNSIWKTITTEGTRTHYYTESANVDAIRSFHIDVRAGGEAYTTVFETATSNVFRSISVFFFGPHQLQVGYNVLRPVTPPSISNRWIYCFLPATATTGETVIIYNRSSVGCLIESWGDVIESTVYKKEVDFVEVNLPSQTYQRYRMFLLPNYFARFLFTGTAWKLVDYWPPTTAVSLLTLFSLPPSLPATSVQRITNTTFTTSSRIDQLWFFPNAMYAKVVQSFTDSSGNLTANQGVRLLRNLTEVWSTTFTNTSTDTVIYFTESGLFEASKSFQIDSFIQGATSSDSATSRYQFWGPYQFKSGFNFISTKPFTTSGYTEGPTYCLMPSAPVVGTRVSINTTSGVVLRANTLSAFFGSTLYNKTITIAAPAPVEIQGSHSCSELVLSGGKIMDLLWENNTWNLLKYWDTV